MPRDSISKTAQVNLQMLAGLGLPEAVRFRDALAHQHGIALLDDRLRRFPDVLCQRENHFSFCVKDAQRRFPTELFFVFRVHAAAERVFHD